jgi:hypothetical protein
VGYDENICMYPPKEPPHCTRETTCPSNMKKSVFIKDWHWFGEDEE